MPTPASPPSTSAAATPVEMPAAEAPGRETTAVWDGTSLADPHGDRQKRDKVRRMFAAIAPAYDLNNRLHSLGIDLYWRRRTVRMADVRPGDHVVDVACGTGDLTLALARAGPARVTGVDFTYEMLPIAGRKTLRRRAAGCPVTYVTGDAQALPLADACCDVVTIAFGIRNVQDVSAALGEFRRVLRPGGRLVILEFSQPSVPLLGALYRWYSTRLMPWTATWVARDRSGAYRYLPSSVATFLTPDELMRRMALAGFSRVVARPLTLGVVTVYRGEVASGDGGRGTEGRV